MPIKINKFCVFKGKKKILLQFINNAFFFFNSFVFQYDLSVSVHIICSLPVADPTQVDYLYICLFMALKTHTHGKILDMLL